MKKSIALFVIINAFLVAVIAQAAGLEVSPSSLKFDLDKNNKQAAKQIVVVNPTQDVQLYEVYADEFSEIIKSLPATFTLEAGAKKTVVIQIDADKLKNKNGQVLATNLSIIGKPLSEDRVNINTGIKIPLTITINVLSNNSPITTPWAGAIALLTLIGLLIIQNIYLKHKARL